MTMSNSQAHLVSVMETEGSHASPPSGNASTSTVLQQAPPPDSRREALESIRPSSPCYGSEAASALANGDAISGMIPGFQVQSIHHALFVMYECFKAANISVAEASPGAPPSPWRLFARPFERTLVDQDNDEAVDRIVRRIQREGQNQIASFQLLHSLQAKVPNKGSSGGGRRAPWSGARIIAGHLHHFLGGRSPPPGPGGDRRGARKQARRYRTPCGDGREYGGDRPRCGPRIRRATRRR